MLTADQIDQLPKGWFPNRFLRRLNPDHGHVVSALDKYGYQTEFIGNRSQYLSELRKPVSGEKRSFAGSVKQSVSEFSIWKWIKKFFKNLFK